MPPLPVLSGMQARTTFSKAGWKFRRQVGSHMIMSKAENQMALSIPDHNELDAGTLRSLIRTAGLSVQEFVDLLK